MVERLVAVESAWSPLREEAFLRLAAGRPWRWARVASVHRSELQVLEEPSWRVLCPSLRRAVLPEERPVVGDWVALAPQGDAWTVEGILPRSSWLARRRSHSGEVQPIAANVDMVLVVTAPQELVSLRRIERYLALASDAACACAVVLNKADLLGDEASLAGLPALAGLTALASPRSVSLVSAREGVGLEALRAQLPAGGVVALLGSSGVGKSSLVNALAGEGVSVTGEVRARDGKGRHTTTRRDLFVTRCGRLLLDTPGMRELGVEEGERDALFAEIAGLAAACRFRDCTHDAEPGCALRVAVAEGVLAGERLAAWRQLVVGPRSQGPASRRGAAVIRRR